MNAPLRYGDVGRGAAHATSRAYTVIEVMIALALLAVGTSGVVAMQKVTTVANRDAKNLVLANQIARTWMERLRADAVQWNHPSTLAATSDLTDTIWLRAVGGDWARPVDNAMGAPTTDALGNDVHDAALAGGTGVFCTNVRLSWLYGPPPNLPPPYLMRAEVRVYWLRDGGGGVVESGKGICDPSIDVSKVSSAVDRYHFVYVTSAIAQNMGR